MFQSMRGKTKLCNYICAALALVLLVFQFTPFWSFMDEGKAKTASINGFVWLNPDEGELVDRFAKLLNPDLMPITKDVKITSVVTVVISCVAILLLSIFSVIFCIKKARNGSIAVVPGLAALAGILTFALNPVYRDGSTWIVQLIICVLLLAAAVVAFMIGSKANAQEKSGHSTKADVAAKVNAIKHMVFDLKALKGDRTLSEVNFNRLLAFLTDESAECRIAAVEMLSTASKEVAYTHIVHLLDSEEDEKVQAAMRSALVSIKKNIAG